VRGLHMNFHAIEHRAVPVAQCHPCSAMKPRRQAQRIAPALSRTDEPVSYLGEGGDLGLFPDGFPTDRAAQVMWTLMRRQVLAEAMHRHAGDEPLIRVRRVPIRGQALHVHESDSQHVDDNFTRGIDRLGALGYSLLRGHLLIQEHLDLRLELLKEAYEDLIAGVVGAREQGLAHPDWLYRERARLIFWDALGLLHQVSEQLASLFEARQRWRRGDGDLGELMVKTEVQGWKTIHSAAFGSAATWRRLVGIPPDRKAAAALSDGQRQLLSDLQRKTELLIMANVGQLRQVWTRDLHRAATRYKHSFPILSVSHGLVWLGEDEETRADVRRLVKDSALVIADSDANGRLEQLVVPVTIGGIEVLFDAVLAAVRVASVLVFSLLQSAEHASGRVLILHPLAQATDTASHEDVVRLMAAYTRTPELLESVEDESAKIQSRLLIEAAARRTRGRQEPA
jgi:hypothetical protein